MQCSLSIYWDKLWWSPWWMSASAKWQQVSSATGPLQRLRKPLVSRSSFSCWQLQLQADADHLHNYISHNKIISISTVQISLSQSEIHMKVSMNYTRNISILERIYRLTLCEWAWPHRTISCCTQSKRSMVLLETPVPQEHLDWKHHVAFVSEQQDVPFREVMRRQEPRPAVSVQHIQLTMMI